MDIPSIQKLQAFFKAFQESGFKPNVNAIPSHTVMRFGGKPTNILINKSEAIGLLRSNFETFKGDDFKDDDAIVKYLSNPTRREEFRKALTEKMGDAGRQQLEEYLEFKIYRPGEEATGTQGQAQEGGAQPEGSSQQNAGGVVQSAGNSGSRMPSLGGNTGRLRQPQAKLVQTPTPQEKELVPGLKSTPETGYDYEGKRDYGPDAYRTGREAWAKEAAAKDARFAEEAKVRRAGAGLRLPKMPAGVGNLAKNFGSRLGVFFKRSVGRFLTLETGVTGFSALLGGIVGRGLGGSVGMLGGAVTGGLTPSFIKSGGGKFLGKIGNGMADVSVRLTNEAHRSASLKKKVSRRALYLLLTMFLVFIFFSAFAAPQKTQPGGTGPGGPGGGSTQNQVSISKTGPDKIEIGQEIPYIITVTYTGTGTANVTVTDTLDNQTYFRSASDNYTSSGNTVAWNLTGLAANSPKLLQLSVTPSVPNGSPGIWVVNSAQAAVVSTSGGGAGPNSNDCGKYKNLTNPLGNFGDPNCNYTEKDAYQALQQLDPANADYWYNTVIPCESSYNPNAYNNDLEQQKNDPAGAWGLTQMGRGKNGANDHGDVEWRQQLANSVDRQHQLNNWKYWGCAKSRW